MNPSGSIAFTPTGIPRRHRDVVARHAVLVPLMGTGGDDSKILDQVSRLFRQRQARLFALAEAGLPEISGGEKQAQRLRYALNCKPWFVLTDERTTCCNLLFCPFCWARWVEAVWVQVDHAFFNASPAGRLPQDLFYRSVTGSVKAQVQDEHGQYWDSIAFNAASRARSRNRVGAIMSLRGDGVGGGFEMLHVNPGKEGGWDLNVRQVLMINPEAPDPKTVNLVCDRFERTHSPTRTGVRDAVARATRYPTFLMRGDPSVAVHYLAARRRRQFSAMTGKFRNKSARPGE